MKRTLLLILVPLTILALALTDLLPPGGDKNREVRRMIRIDGPPANGSPVECQVPRGCWVPATGQNLPEEIMTRGELYARINKLKPPKKPLYVMMPTPEQFRRDCAKTNYPSCSKVAVVN
jgi:hypothetical protein